MRPEGVRVWRKTARASAKGSPRGRRSTHLTLINAPRRGSTWPRRNPGEFGYYLATAGRGLIPADMRKASAPDAPGVLALTDTHPNA